MSVAALRPSFVGDAQFRQMTEDDIPEMVELGVRFFNESGLPEFATVSPDNLKIALTDGLVRPSIVNLLFVVDGVIEGFMIYQMEVSYTVEPMALLSLFYVTPEYRRGPAGRILLETAISMAKASGCCAFYAGSMAEMGGTSNSLGNMYRKFGFKDLGFWGRLSLGNKET